MITEHTVEASKAMKVIDLLIDIAQGPRESLALLCFSIVLLVEMDAKQRNVKPMALEEIAEKAHRSILSMKDISNATH